MALTQKRPKVDDTSRDTSPDRETQQISMSENSEAGAENIESVSNTESETSVQQFWYTKTQLLDIANNPLSKKRPNCLDPAYNNALGMWDPEKWFMGKRRAESPLPDDKSKREKPPDLDRESLFKRRPSDPKERLKDEQDNIILSPQRRSFGTGCHVSQQSSNRRPESPCELRGIDRESHREPNRRIGSGRIISRDRDNRQERDFGFRNNERRDRDRFERDERELRFSNRNRDFPERKNRGRHQRIEEEEEPEWFSSGPTSQSETIELHGFEDIPEKDWDDDDEPKGKRWRRGSWRKTKPVIEENGIPEEDEKEEEETEENKTASRSPSVASQIVKTTSKDSQVKSQTGESNAFTSLPQDFDVNKLFELDSIPAILPNGTPPDTSRGSRFSQWFHSESPVPVTAESGPNSRRSSQHDELVGNLINDINEPSVMIPSPGVTNETYFEPISPAQTSDNSKNILELLHGAPVETFVKNENFKNSSLQELVVTGQAQNVQEIEAGLKQLVLGNHISNNNKTNNNVQNGSTPPVCQSNEGDLSAFKKLLVQISEGQAHTVQQGMHFSPLDKSRMLQEKDIDQIGKSQISLQKMDKTVPVVGRQSPVSFHKNPNLMRLLQDAPTEQDILAGHNKRHSPQQQQQQLPSNQPSNSYSDFLMQILHQHQQLPQSQQQQSQILSSQRSTQENSLAKLLTSSSASQLRSCSPVMQDLIVNQMKRQSNERSDLTNYTSGSVTHQLNRNQVVPQHIPNKLLQQQQQQRQHQREILATIVKQQQQQQQQLQQAATAAVAGNQLQPQIIQPSVSPPNNLLQTGLNRSLSPRPTSPHAPDALQQALFQPTQPRIPSPLIFGQTPPLLPHAPSPIHPNQVAPAIAPIGPTLNPNSLQVYSNPLIQRVPSPQELVLHTQQIMQNALIKSKLEEQKENYRKRQEMQRTRSPNVQTTKMSSEGSPSKVTSLSTTMAAFTPTSVMRKMQAEKDKDCVKVDTGSQLTVGNKGNDSKLSLQQQQQQQQLKNQNVGNGLATSESDKIPRPLHGQGVMHSHISTRGPSALNPSQQGRAIVKGNQGLNPSLLTNKSTGVQNQKLGVGTGSLSNAQNKNANHNNNIDVNKLLEQQRMLQNAQRQLNVSPMPASSMPHAAYPIRGGGAIHPNIGRSGVNIPPNLLLRSMVHPNLNQAAVRAQLNQLALLQQHALDPHRLNLAHSAATLQHLLLGTAATPRSQPPSINLQNPTVGMTAPKTDAQPFSHLQSGNLSTSNLNNNFGMGNTLGAGGNIGNPSTNRHSPINNLSKWFNSDVLKQKLPDMPPVPTQKALSLEEVERRQQQTTVHN